MDWTSCMRCSSVKICELRSESAERGEALEECPLAGRRPDRLDIGYKSGNKQQIQRALAEDLISDVNVVALHVMRCGSAIHAACRGRTAGNSPELPRKC